MTTKTKLGPKTLLYPMPAVLVGALVHGKPNFMTAAWTGIACATPPMLSVAIRPNRYTREGISVGGVFSINVPRVAQATPVDYLGIVSGRDEDKNARAGLAVFFGDLLDAPMIAQCPLCLECRVAHILALGSHDLVVGEIVQTHVDEDCLTDGVPDVSKLDPLVYATGTRTYHGVGPAVAQAYRAGLELRAKGEKRGG
jgi:flavin reductase (DIM6/NTAB) family NADH-FMN oxidoreductase RutF